MSTPEFICNRTPWVRWYLPPSAEQSKSTSTTCRYCGGRRLQPFREGWHHLWDVSPLNNWREHRKIEVDQAYIRWVRHNKKWSLTTAQVNSSRHDGEAKQARRPHHAELDPEPWVCQIREENWHEPYVNPEIVPWDWDFGTPSRGPRLMYAEDVLLAELYAKGILQDRRVSEWGESLENEPKMEDIEGSYIVRYRAPKKRGWRRSKTPPKAALVEEAATHQGKVDVEFHNETMSECTDDSFELISNADSWYLVDTE